jgi:hypothetical protein
MSAIQIADHPTGTVANTRTTPLEQIVMFMSFSLTPAESRYHTTEREVQCGLVNHCRCWDFHR